MPAFELAFFISEISRNAPDCLFSVNLTNIKTSRNLAEQRRAECPSGYNGFLLLEG
jgi:hypothetical protein